MTKKRILTGLLLLLLFLLTACNKPKEIAKDDSGSSGFENVMVYLWPNENATIEEINADEVTLNDRLQDLFGYDYQLVKEEDKLLLTYPRSYQKNMDTSSFLSLFLTDPADYSICNGNKSYDSSITDIAKDDYLSIEAVDQQIKIRFSDRVITSLIPYRENDVPLIFKNCNLYPSANHLYYDSFWLTTDSEDDEVYYLNLSDMGNLDSSYANILINNIMKHSLNHPYNYKIVHQEIQWQDVNEETSNAGYNQCNEEEIKDDYYVFHYSLYQRLTDEEFHSMESIIKSRLDALDCPYSFSNTLNISFSVKISPKHINMAIMKSLINSYYFKLRYGCNEAYISLLEGSNTIYYDGDINSLDILFGNMDEINALIDQPGKTLYLLSGDCVVASMPVAKKFDNDEIRFLEFPITTASHSSEEWFSEYLDCLFNDYFQNEIYLDDFYYVDYNGYQNEDHFSLGAPYQEENEEIIALVKELAPNASTKITEDSCINVYFHHEPDNNLLKDTIPQIEAIYNGFDFVNSHYSNLCFYLYDQEKTERCYFTFMKTSEKVTLYVSFFNGRSNLYKEELSQIMEENSFLKQYLDYENEFIYAGVFLGE